MVKKNKRMSEIQRSLRNLLNLEFWLCDMFNGTVETGVMDNAKLSELGSKAKEPNLHKQEIEKLKKEDIMTNPYLSNIKVPRVSSNDFHLSNKRIIRPGYITKYKCKSRDLETLQQKNSYFICDDSLRFPSLIEGDSNTCWMTVEPFEIESFRPFIEEASGNILLIGCGLGYAAYMLSEKENVNSITIIDNNQDVLELFNNHLLPQFKNKNKIHTIQDDGIKYLKENDLSIYDHVNVDIWYDTVDMIYPYLRCLEIEKANPEVNFSYWLEEELKEQIQKTILAAIANDGVPEKQKVDYVEADFLSAIIGKDLVSKTPINNVDDIYNLLTLNNFRDTMFEWYANNLETVERQENEDLSMLKLSHLINNADMISEKLFTKKPTIL